MKFYIVIPAHNEEEFILKTLQSLVEQTYLPEKVLVVNDNSTDQTEEIVERFSQKHPFVSVLSTTSSEEHMPGSKVVNAFNKGLETLDQNYDIICKFDADLIFPPDYFEKLSEAFQQNKKLGISGGFCYIKEQQAWKLENLTDKNHIRGALKAYRKECFQEIGGLKNSMGWDTVDELLAKYHQWEVKTIEGLKVKHLRPTGKTYNKASRYKQGEAFYKLRYGFNISFIASAKLAMLKKDPSLFKDYLKGYFLAKKENLPFLVSEEEGRWIRKYRWKKMKEKLF